MATLKERLAVAYQDGKDDAFRDAHYAASQEFNSSKEAAKRDLLRAAAELANANAKLTYAISQMLQK